MVHSTIDKPQNKSTYKSLATKWLTVTVQLISYKIDQHTIG